MIHLVTIIDINVLSWIWLFLYEYFVIGLIVQLIRLWHFAYEISAWLIHIMYNNCFYFKFLICNNNIFYNRPSDSMRNTFCFFSKKNCFLTEIFIIKFAFRITVQIGSLILVRGLDPVFGRIRIKGSVPRRNGFFKKDSSEWII